MMVKGGLDSCIICFLIEFKRVLRWRCSLIIEYVKEIVFGVSCL